MKGDFSRIRFNPAKQYTAVIQQQGRVSLDADSNEQSFIDSYLGRNETVDVIGTYGAPEHDAGFAITISGNEILIRAGRYYVDGIVCENLNAQLGYSSQPFLLNPSPVDSALLSELIQQGGNSAIQVYLQVFQRLVTALDDPCIREPALGQASDPTARLQTVWRVVASLVPPIPITKPPFRQVFGNLLEAKQNLASTLKLNLASEKFEVAQPQIDTLDSIITKIPIILPGMPHPVLPAPVITPPPAATPPPPPPDCCVTMYATKPTVSTGTMSAATSPGGSGCSCQPIPSAGYQGLENQLYRVEIHHPGDETTATFKWSRENASVVTSITNVSGQTIFVDSLGPDDNLGFQANQWIEISDDTDLFGEVPNQPGLLYQIQNVDPTVPSITLTAPVIGIDKNRNARARRWDQTGASVGTTGIPLTPGTWIALENGIQVNFSTGTYQSGDYWTIPARAASGTIDWPPCSSDGDLFQPPHSIVVYNAPLACIHWNPQTQQTTVEDCRRFFSPLTELSAPSASTALHITDINWTNDSVITADVWVANGLTLSLDGAPTSPITGAEFVVTLESIFNPFSANLYLPGYYTRDTTSYLPSTFLRTIFAVDSNITVKGSSIAWSMPYTGAPLLQLLTVQAINAGLIFGASLGQYARVRIRLLGEAISSGTGSTQIFLDGRSFGQPITNANGSSRINLQLPSGAGEASSDFESWFYLAPTLLITSLTLAYPALYVIAPNGVITGVAAAPVNPSTKITPVSPFVTITTNYHALVDTEITLSLQDATGAASTYANVESPITIHAGEESVNAAINVTGNPMVNGQYTTVTITVQASILTAVGAIAATPVTFTLTGGYLEFIQ
jgi:Family of unknown function (DUF6519)